MHWRNVYRGFIIGTCDLIPGVSGGTMALMFGIYDELLQSISGFFSRDWARHLPFLLPLAVGAAAALLSLSRVVDYLLAEHPLPTHLFFVGLIVGLIPLLVRSVDAPRRFRSGHVAIMIVAAVFVATMRLFVGDEAAAPVEMLTPLTVVGLFAAGAAASTAMLLPGISGSFILLVLGVYSTAIHALATFHIPLIATIGSGVVVGFIASSKLIGYLLSHHRDMTYAAIIGLIVGSLFVVFPAITMGTPLFVGIATFFIGLGLTLRFGRAEA